MTRNDMHVCNRSGDAGLTIKWRAAVANLLYTTSPRNTDQQIDSSNSDKDDVVWVTSIENTFTYE